MGDLMFYLRNPRVDRGAGASIRNWIVTLESVVKDHPADTIYIAGHSKVNLPVTVTRADLLEFRDYFSGLLGYVQKAIASGRSAPEIVKVASVPGFADYEGSPEGTIQAAYESSQSRRERRGATGPPQAKRRRAGRGAPATNNDENVRRSAARVQHWCCSGTRSRTASPRARGNACRERDAHPARPRSVGPGQSSRERGGLADHRRARTGDCNPHHARIDSGSDRGRRYRAGTSRAARARQRRFSDLLLRAADACRTTRAFDCATSMYRRARQAAGRSIAGDEAAIGLAATLEQEDKPREALETYRELQLTFREVTAFGLADAGARRLSSRLGAAEPLTEADYDTSSIACRRRGISPRRDMQTEG